MLLRKVIISGGGTGGHIFPAIAIADEIKKRNPAVEILFVGAAGRMEMQKVPEAGYAIEGINISGLQRKASLGNLLLPFKVIRSLGHALSIIKKFNPQVVIGVGGYASGPLLFAAQLKGIPTLIQEQNGYAGITNKILGRRARKICVAYDGMEAFFPASKIVKTGNPVRPEMLRIPEKRQEAMAFFGLDSSRPVVLSIGGSLGAGTINHGLRGCSDRFRTNNVQLIWQTGRAFYSQALKEQYGGIHVFEFIRQMDLAYAAADIVISRAGALSVSELCLAGKPAILIPSPNVAEDHQTKNAAVLVNQDAALMVKDGDVQKMLWQVLSGLLNDTALCRKLSENIRKHGKENAAGLIVDQIEKISG
jgi:UDP-N-acetylglucosamine--N-acetylmuramyl-(pentapeptide) pyrophosphoryl-undecaprenol N-acetylglucosamine transferase